MFRINELHFWVPLILWCTILFSSCKGERKIETSTPLAKAKTDVINKQQRSSDLEFFENPLPYNFDYHSDLFILDRSLTEISGLTYLVNEDELLAINDELGHFYHLEASSGRITNDRKFSKRGDFEGLAVDGFKVYIAKHNGHIYSYDLISSEVDDFKTGLHSRNDVEGLCIHKESNHLLLACKGQGLQKSKSKSVKEIYAYSLSENRLIEKPFLSIKDKILVEWVKENHKHLSKKKRKKLEARVKDFSPSGIAIHPKTKEVFIVSARGSSLVVMNSTGDLVSLVFLNEKTIPQPEGICFDADGNLFISTEGHGFSGKIFKYNANE